MYRKAVFMAVGCLALAGCANNQQIGVGFTAPVQAAEQEPEASQQTLASKVLSAIALERVTGAKPDPSRLQDMR